jgi:hypothetical protein
MVSFSRFLGTIAGLIVLAGVVAVIREGPQPHLPAAAPSAAPPAAPAKPTVYRWEVLERLPVTKRVFRGTSGDPLTGSFTVENKNDFAIKDFTIRFTFYGNSGSMIGSRDRTYYELISAKGSKRLKDARLGFMPDQGTSVSAEVVDYGVP